MPNVSTDMATRPFVPFLMLLILLTMMIPSADTIVVLITVAFASEHGQGETPSQGRKNSPHWMKNLCRGGGTWLTA